MKGASSDSEWTTRQEEAEIVESEWTTRELVITADEAAGLGGSFFVRFEQTVGGLVDGLGTAVLLDKLELVETPPPLSRLAPPMYLLDAVQKRLWHTLHVTAP